MNRATYETIEVKSISNHIIHAAFNRPNKLNAMNQQFFNDIASFFTAVNNDPEVRVVILTGNGKAFSAGLDLKEFASKLDFSGGEGNISSYVDAGRNAIKIRTILK